MPCILQAPAIAKRRAKRLSESGTILYLKSIMESARSIKKLSPMKSIGTEGEYFVAKLKKMSPEINSMIGY